MKSSDKGYAGAVSGSDGGDCGNRPECSGSPEYPDYRECQDRYDRRENPDCGDCGVTERAARLVLGSQSPRRREILAMLGIPFCIEPVKGHGESYPDGMEPAEVPEFLARGKAADFARELRRGEVLVCADTLVFLDSAILGKPSCRDEAVEMLRSLSGREHCVRTGVALKSCDGRLSSFTDTTFVEFKPLPEADILYYVDTFAPFDKAGAYGIQEWIGITGIRAIRGSYFNVMGLPLHPLYTELRKIGHFSPAT